MSRLRNPSAKQLQNLENQLNEAEVVSEVKESKSSGEKIDHTKYLFFLSSFLLRRIWIWFARAARKELIEAHASGNDSTEQILSLLANHAPESSQLARPRATNKKSENNVSKSSASSSHNKELESQPITYSLPSSFAPEFRLELAVYIDAGKILVDATARLEGDGFLAPFASDLINTIRLAPGVIQFSNLEAELSYQNYDVITMQQKFAVYTTKILPAYEYINEVFDNDPCLRDSLKIFQTCKWLLPTSAKYMDTSKFLNDIISSGLMQQPEVTDLLKELPVYLQLASTVGTEMNPYNLFDFFVDHRDKLRMFYVLACRAALLQPSSATSERVFSMLEASLKSNMGSLLGDGISGRVLLRYNYLWRYNK